MPVDESSDHQVTSPVMCPTATPFRTVVVQAVPHEGSGRVVSGVVSETAKLLSVPASDADPQAETYSAAHLALSSSWTAAVARMGSQRTTKAGW
jgi:hypothetical protein